MFTWTIVNKEDVKSSASEVVKELKDMDIVWTSKQDQFKKKWIKVHKKETAIRAPCHFPEENANNIVASNKFKWKQKNSERDH